MTSSLRFALCSVLAFGSVAFPVGMALANGPKAETAFQGVEDAYRSVGPVLDFQGVKAAVWVAPETVIMVRRVKPVAGNVGASWTCGPARDLVQGSGTVRDCK